MSRSLVMARVCVPALGQLAMCCERGCFFSSLQVLLSLTLASFGLVGLGVVQGDLICPSLDLLGMQHLCEVVSCREDTAVHLLSA